MKLTRPRTLFFLMFCITMLLNVNFTILRSVRSTLAVVDLGSSASTIPIFELFGALPGSIVMAWGLSLLMRRFSIQKVFFFTMAIFLGFFLLFALGLYPALVALRQKGEVSQTLLQLFSMSFYVMGELWKPALAIILFWGLVNQHMPIEEAKKLYAPLMFGASLGGILTGPLVSLCTSERLWKLLYLSAERWTHSLMMMMFLVSLFGVIAAYFYYRVWLYFSSHSPEKMESSSKGISLKESASLCLRVPELRLLSWIVIADYIAYSLGEVIFLDVLKRKFPLACDYCNYMGKISAWSGTLTVLSALFLAPAVLSRCRWIIAALATPICLLATEGAFFIFLRAGALSSSWFGWSEGEWIGVIIFLGSLQYCLCRAAKYTLFDASKEIAFVLMPEVHKMKGKLIVDGICARIGRGAASTMSLSFIALCGGVFASALLTGFVALGMAMSWIFSTRKLARLLEKERVEEPLST